MRLIPSLIILASITFLQITAVAEEKDTIPWLKGSKNFGAASEKAQEHKKLLLLDFFHPH